MAKYISLRKLAVFILVTCMFATSCSKKSSDNPAPATNNGGGSGTTEKPTAPNTTDKSSSTKRGEASTGVPPTTPITLDNGASVQDHAQQRSGIEAAGNGSSLDNLLGLAGGQLRVGEDKFTYYGWYIADMTVNGTVWTNQQIYNRGFQSIFFFNMDVSGYYWQYNYLSQRWFWGTWGIDKDAKYIAFDFDSEKKPNELWEIVRVTGNRMVVQGEYNIDGVPGDEKIIIGLNGYDIYNNSYSGQMQLTNSERQFVGDWNLIYYIVDGEPIYDSSSLLVSSDGKWKFGSPSDDDDDYSYGSWAIEPVYVGYDDTFYMYATSAEEDGQIVTEKYIVSISAGYMVMVLESTTDPEGQGSVGIALYFQKHK